MFLFLLLIFSRSAFSSFCGRGAVPFSVEILQSGAPVLGCAQPSCIATIEGDDYAFQKDSQGQYDGYLRPTNREDGTEATRKSLATCSGEFNELSCDERNQWVGGIEYIAHPRQPLLLQCCTFEGLRHSQEVGVTTVGPGEQVTGAEVTRNGRQISFDIISNVRKIIDRSEPQSVSYEVTVRRMHCLPDPPEFVVPYDEDVNGEIVKVLTKANNSAVDASNGDGDIATSTRRRIVTTTTLSPLPIAEEDVPATPQPRRKKKDRRRPLASAGLQSSVVESANQPLPAAPAPFVTQQGTSIYNFNHLPGLTPSLPSQSSVPGLAPPPVPAPFVFAPYPIGYSYMLRGANSVPEALVTPSPPQFTAFPTFAHFQHPWEVTAAAQSTPQPAAVLPETQVSPGQAALGQSSVLPALQPQPPIPSPLNPQPLPPFLMPQMPQPLPVATIGAQSTNFFAPMLPVPQMLPLSPPQANVQPVVPALPQPASEAASATAAASSSAANPQRLEVALYTPPPYNQLGQALQNLQTTG